jgi:Na+/melibiose symporter-like transporter
MITWNGSVFLKKIKNKKFVKLLIANCISRVGDSIDMLAFSWLIYAMTNSVAWSAIIVGINQGTSIIFQPLVGAIVERFPKKKTMIISDYCRFFL